MIDEPIAPGTAVSRLWEDMLLADERKLHTQLMAVSFLL
ncbi:Hypothetical protein Cp106_1521 [Corynebacterium pseudotuberculosis 1/06-A]|nr:Hypothetical protein Cp106_1521 [Corynebacterium pseudotuberculosis 1/06-A]